MKLFQRAKTGKVKWIEVFTEGPTMISQWGVIGSDKVQRVEKICTAKNVGKVNHLTAEQQALAEMEAKLQKKKDKGYVENLEDINETAVVDIDLDNLPRSFCPCKPGQQKSMKDVFRDHPDTYGQRKRDGHCIILVKPFLNVCEGEDTWQVVNQYGEAVIDDITTESSAVGELALFNKVYSRGMENITFYMKDIPVIQEFFTNMNPGDMVFTEMCFVKDGKDSTREVSKIVRKKDPVEVLKRYIEATKTGTFEIVPFDIMFSSNKFIGDKSYSERKKILDQISTNVPEIYKNWKKKIEYARESQWEGFILRNDTLGSQVHYSLNGKADRAGSFKYIFQKNDDFVVTSAKHGKSGRHANYYAQFFIAQYVDDQLIDFGQCGPGILDDGELKTLKERIDSGELKFPFAVEIEFRDRHSDTGKLMFPVLQRLREDKRIEECIFELDKKEA